MFTGQEIAAEKVRPVELLVGQPGNAVGGRVIEFRLQGRGAPHQGRLGVIAMVVADREVAGVDETNPLVHLGSIAEANDVVLIIREDDGRAKMQHMSAFVGVVGVPCPADGHVDSLVVVDKLLGFLRDVVEERPVRPREGLGLGVVRCGDADVA